MPCPAPHQRAQLTTSLRHMRQALCQTTEDWKAKKEAESGPHSPTQDTPRAGPHVISVVTGKAGHLEIPDPYTGTKGRQRCPGSNPPGQAEESKQWPLLIHIDTPLRHCSVPAVPAPAGAHRRLTGPPLHVHYRILALFSLSLLMNGELTSGHSRLPSSVGAKLRCICRVGWEARSAQTGTYCLPCAAYSKHCYPHHAPLKLKATTYV